MYTYHNELIGSVTLWQAQMKCQSWTTRLKLLILNPINQLFGNNLGSLSATTTTERGLWIRQMTVCWRCSDVVGYMNGNTSNMQHASLTAPNLHNEPWLLNRGVNQTETSVYDCLLGNLLSFFNSFFQFIDSPMLYCIFFYLGMVDVTK